MRSLRVRLAAACLTLSSAFAETAAAPSGRPAPSVTLEDLRSTGGVRGALAVPLGTVVSIEAEVIEGSAGRGKAREGERLLQVLSVDGRTLAEPALLHFAWFPLARAPMDLGPGRRVKVVGYETGSFVGIPKDAWVHLGAPAASTPFHFQTSIVVLKALE